MVQIAGTEVGPLGYGLMGFTWRHQPIDIDEAVKTIRVAVTKHNVRLWNAGEFYGSPEYNSLHIIRRYFETYPEDRDKIRFSVKGALDFVSLNPTVDEAGIQKSIKFCQSILGNIPLDIYEPARLDPDLGVEPTLNALKKAYDAGQVRAISLSEASAATVELAGRILGEALVTVEVEMSMFTPDPLENGVAAACKKLGIPMTGYSPLGRGMLTGKIRTPDDLPAAARLVPRFQGKNFKLCMKLVDEVVALAAAKGVTPAQIAIGWLVSISGRGGNPEILAIPGAVSVDRLGENFTPATLSEDDLSAIAEIMERIEVPKGRYGDAQSKYTSV